MALGRHEQILVDRALKALGENGRESQIPNIVSGIIANEHLPPGVVRRELETQLIRKTKEAFRARNISEAIKKLHSHSKR